MDAATFNRWHPVLSGPMVEDVRTVITVVGEESRYTEDSACSAVRLSEQALLLCYLGHFEASAPWVDDALLCLNAAGSRITANLGLDLFGGLSGIGWVYSHVSKQLASTPGIEIDSEDPIVELDSLILEKTKRAGQRGSYDLISGLVAGGVYFLERLPLESAVTGLSLILQVLEERAECSSHGITWHTAPELLPRHQRDVCPTGHYNLGLAHGVPAVIRFLVELIDAGIHVATAERMLDGAVEWLIAQQRDPSQGAYYGNWKSPTSETCLDHLAWCYGDLGVAAALYQAGQRADRTDWIEFAATIASGTLNRSVDELEGAGLCHGAAGIAQIYCRFFQLSHREEYRKEAVRYFEWVLQDLGTRNGGSSRKARQMNLTDNEVFLEGDIGVALALLSAIAPIEPRWDRRLMLSGWGARA